MQDFLEKKFPPFTPRLERLQSLLGMNRGEVAGFLGVTPQGLNKSLDDPPTDRRMLVELLIERLETGFTGPGAALEALIRDIVRDELSRVNLLPAADAIAGGLAREISQKQPIHEPESPRSQELPPSGGGRAHSRSGSDVGKTEKP